MKNLVFKNLVAFTQLAIGFILLATLGSCKKTDPDDPIPFEYQGNWVIYEFESTDPQNFPATDELILSGYHFQACFKRKYDVAGQGTSTLTSSNSYFYCTDFLCPTQDNGILNISHYSHASSNVTYSSIMRLDNNLDSLWSKRYYSGFFLKTNDATALENGNFALSQSQADTVPVISYDHYITVINANGIPIWDYGIGNGTDVQFLKLAPGKDGGVIAVKGKGIPSNISTSVELLDSTGSLVWSQSLTGSYSPKSCGRIKKSGDGSLYVPITDQNDEPWVLKINENGTEIWSRQIIEDDLETADLFPTQDGGCVILGHSYAENDFYPKLGVVKLDNNGQTEWSTTFGQAGREYPGKIFQLNDGNYLVTGNTDGFGLSYDNEYKTFLLWLSPAGEILD